MIKSTVRATATNQESRVAEAPKAARSNPGHAMLLNISTYGVVVAFGALWFEFFRNLAALPSIDVLAFPFLGFWCHGRRPLAFVLGG
jgi:hypothetical protein